MPTQQRVWIADTCIECDDQRFGGYLKVSVGELLITLRDDRHLLDDPGGLLVGNYGVDDALKPVASESGWSLYPDGFSAERFAEVIQTEGVWEVRTATHDSGALFSTRVASSAPREETIVRMLLRGRTLHWLGGPWAPEG